MLTFRSNAVIGFGAVVCGDFMDGNAATGFVVRRVERVMLHCVSDGNGSLGNQYVHYMTYN